MRRLWQEFKGFAMSGNMLDLALGFLIGTAFATLIQSLANNVLMQFVAAIFGKQDFTKLAVKINGADIFYGSFLTDLLNFLMLAGVLFLIVKLIMFVGVGQQRAFGDKQCPYCRERVAPAAMVCKWCRQQLVAELPPLAEAQRLLEEHQSRRRVSVPLPPLSIPGRRRTAAEPESVGEPGDYN